MVGGTDGVCVQRQACLLVFLRYGLMEAGLFGCTASKYIICLRPFVKIVFTLHKA